MKSSSSKSYFNGGSWWKDKSGIRYGCGDVCSTYVSRTLDNHEEDFEVSLTTKQK